VSRESLQQLIEHGLLALPPTRLGDLADWFAEHDRYGGVPAETVVELDGLMGRELAMIVAAPDPASGAMLGRELREAVHRLLSAS
jgi:hypothetical protein